MPSTAGKTQTSTRKKTANAPLAAPPAASSPADLDAQIRQRAYELYEQRGRQDGFAEQDWLQAEAELALARTA